MNRIDINAERDITVTVAPWPEGAGGKTRKFEVSARFGDLRDRILGALGKTTGRKVLLLTGRRDEEELPVCMPIFTATVPNFSMADTMSEMAPMFNTLVERGWTPVFKAPTGAGMWTLEVEAVAASEQPQQEVGGVMHVTDGGRGPTFRGEF